MKTYKIFDLEIGEGLGMYTYDDAVDQCKSIGTEWRLPRLKELKMLRNNYYRTEGLTKNLIDLQTLFYWTSDYEIVLTEEYPKDNLRVWVYNMNLGRSETRFSKNTSYKLMTLPVRNIKIQYLEIS